MVKRFNWFVIVGLLLLAAALLLTVYNLRQDAAAGASSAEVLSRLMEEIPDSGDSFGNSSGDAAQQGSSTDNFYPSSEDPVPNYVLNPNMDMPETKIGAYSYVGYLSIPALSLDLPIITSWSSSGSLVAPCRYSGSVYLGNMVIAGHNYSAHFRYLRNLKRGDTVTFTDMDGNVFEYLVADTEILSPTSVAEMTAGDYPLTLFTCTVGAQARVTIRCTAVEE